MICCHWLTFLYDGTQFVGSLYTRPCILIYSLISRRNIKLWRATRKNMLKLQTFEVIVINYPFFLIRYSLVFLQVLLSATAAHSAVLPGKENFDLLKNVFYKNLMAIGTYWQYCHVIFQWAIFLDFMYLCGFSTKIFFCFVVIFVVA